MKIAIALIGISEGFRGRNWNRTKNGIKKDAIDCWVEQGHEVKLYLTGNHIPSDMIDFYNPTKYEVIHINLMAKYLAGLQQLKGEDVDFIICTRFDMVFLDKLSNWNIDFNKFNFLFREKNHFYDGRKMTCDNFYAFPVKYLDSFIQALLDPSNPPFKGAFHDQVYNGLEKLIGESNIHFIEEQEGFSGNLGNIYYLLDRDDTVDDIKRQIPHVPVFFYHIPNAKNTPYAERLFSSRSYPSLDVNNIHSCGCEVCVSLGW